MLVTDYRDGMNAGMAPQNPPWQAYWSVLGSFFLHSPDIFYIL